MNAVHQAMKTAGIKLPPLNKRVWLWLKDHPEKAYDEVASALGVEPKNAAQALYDLKCRGMVTIYSDVRKAHGRHGIDVKVQRYSIKYRDWELLPKQPMPSARKKITMLVHATPAPVVSKPETNGTKKRGRPVGDTPANRPVVQLNPDEVALIDKFIEEFTDEHDLVLSRPQFVAMLIKRYARSRHEKS